MSANTALAVVERDQRGEHVDSLKRLLVEVAETNHQLALAQARTTAMLDAVEARLDAMLGGAEERVR
jgi:hypothetical protein